MSEVLILGSAGTAGMRKAARGEKQDTRGKEAVHEPVRTF